jgi:uncharacterized protein (DUF952 family)
MDKFFEVWDIAKKYGLTRRVVINFQEAYIRIYKGEQVIVRADGEYDETEHLYLTAANRLLDWLERENK